MYTSQWQWQWCAEVLQQYLIDQWNNAGVHHKVIPYTSANTNKSTINQPRNNYVEIAGVDRYLTTLLWRSPYPYRLVDTTIGVWYGRVVCSFYSPGPHPFLTSTPTGIFPFSLLLPHIDILLFSLLYLATTLPANPAPLPPPGDPNWSGHPDAPWP